MAAGRAQSIGWMLLIDPVGRKGPDQRIWGSQKVLDADHYLGWEKGRITEFWPAVACSDQLKRRISAS